MSRRKGPKQPPRTLRQFRQRANDGVRLLQGPASRPPGTIPITRLGIWWHGPHPHDAAQIADVIATTRPDAIYFCDSTEFIAPTDARIWEALLTARRIALIPPIVSELACWLNSPKENLSVHKHIKAALDGDDSAPIHLVNLHRPESIAACEYYVNLLGMRKKMFELARFKLEEELGRVPTKQELSNYCQQIGTPRAQLLARQGESVKVAAHRFNDECLVVVAMLTAITTGREVTIFTRDEAVLEQFYKLVWLIDTHYRSMLLAERYSHDPFAFPMRRFDNPHKEAFTDDSVLLLRKPSANLSELLPAAHSSVVVNCVLMQEQVTQYCFCAEREMWRLIEVKARTNGLNTDRLEGKNCHVFLGDRAMQMIGNWAAIAHDQAMTLPGRELKLSVVDIDLTMLPSERCSQARLVDPKVLILPPGHELD